MISDVFLKRLFRYKLLNSSACAVWSEPSVLDQKGYVMREINEDPDIYVFRYLM